MLQPLTFDESAELSLNRISEGYNGVENLPGYLRISLLEACNERCFFCHNEGYIGSRNKRISPWIVYRAVQASLDLGKNKFKFTGGEPTLDSRLPEYIKFIKDCDQDSQVGIVTNATKLTRVAPKLAKAGLDSMIVSLHTLDPQKYKEITGIDGLTLALEGIRSAKEEGIRDITVNSVISKINVDEIVELREYCNREGLSIRLLDILPTDDYSKSVRVDPKDLARDHPDMSIKPKLFHDKCNNCSSKSICGEGEYLRLSASNTLDPCMYRPDLKIDLKPTDTPSETLLKMALGFRRIQKDDL